MKDKYFVIQDVQKVDDGQMRLNGQFILDGAVTVNSDSTSSSSSSGDTKKPPYDIKPPKLFEVKWILPPEGSPAYGRSKAFAESMGYDTVEHDDFSYPGR